MSPDPVSDPATTAELQRFLGLLRARQRQHIDYQDLLTDFLATRPSVQSSGHVRVELLGLLHALDNVGQLSLPRGKKHWMPGEPPVPRWIRLAKEKRPATDGTVWLPRLAFAAKYPAGPQRETLRCINAWLRECGPPQEQVPLRERSLEIFGDEKRLDRLVRPDGGLFGGQLQAADLGCFRVAVPLPFESLEPVSKGQPILVVENHHTYWSLCRWNLRTGRYAAVAYGAGNAFSSAAEHLDDIRRLTGGGVLRYLGDIDNAGLAIPARVDRRRREFGLVEIRPEKWLYAWLLENGVRRPVERAPTDEQIASWHDWLTPDLRPTVIQLLRAGLRIPQESIGTSELSRWLFVESSGDPATTEC